MLTSVWEEFVRDFDFLLLDFPASFANSHTGHALTTKPTGEKKSK